MQCTHDPYSRIDTTQEKKTRARITNVAITITFLFLQPIQHHLRPRLPRLGLRNLLTRTPQPLPLHIRLNPQTALSPRRPPISRHKLLNLHSGPLGCTSNHPISLAVRISLSRPQTQFFLAGFPRYLSFRCYSSCFGRRCYRYGLEV